MATIRRRANPPPPKKPPHELRQKPKPGHAVIDPLVNPGNSPHRHQTRSKADSIRTYHRMVILAQGSPGCRPARAPQNEKATVMSEQTTNIFALENLRP
jgi:hypothetical protein